MTKKELRKQKAIERLEHLVKTKSMCEEVLDEYKNEDVVHYTERMKMGNTPIGILYWLNDAGGAPEDVVAKKEEVEKKYDVTIYAVTHEYLEFGECWDYWCVMDEDVEESEYYDEGFTKYGETMAYVFNRTDPTCSEFGTILVDVSGGGMLRVG